MTAMPDLWPTLRGALAETTRAHWSTLRKISATTDPRLISAEAVATAALAYLAEPATWLAAQVTLAGDQAEEIATAANIDRRDLASALRRLEALDIAASAWAETAYQRANRR